MKNNVEKKNLGIFYVIPDNNIIQNILLQNKVYTAFSNLIVNSNSLLIEFFALKGTISSQKKYLVNN